MISGREKFGAFIRREREAKGLSLRDMAKKIKVSPDISVKGRDRGLEAGRGEAAENC